MKKGFFMLVIAVFASIFMISCDGDTGNTGNTGDSGDSGDSGNIGEMVAVAAGAFHMGCNEVFDAECGSDEFPYHSVTLTAYKIDKYEVTAGEYQKCVDAGDCNNKKQSEPHYATHSDSSTCNLGMDGKEDHPINCVTWYGAKAYCEWAGKKLPTEAQWEKAARGTDGRRYPWGNEPGISCNYAVMYDSKFGGNGCGTRGTMPVGSKEAGKSPYGAYDMVGNVWEWVSDWYGETYYETTPESNPAGPESGTGHVFRGGSWYGRNDGGVDLRASARDDTQPDHWGSNGGFRCVK